MDPEATAARIIHMLEDRSDAEFASGQRKFFQEQLPTVGTRGDNVKLAAAEAWRSVRDWPYDDRNRFMEILWNDGRLECGGVVCHAYRRFTRQFGEREFDQFEAWIDRYVTNWAYCDGLASWLIAGCIANKPALKSRLRPWTKSKNRWKRRASVVALVPSARKGLHTDFLLGVASRLVRDDDDMVRKGLGWLLKDAWPKQPEAVSAFLEAHLSELPALVLRIAKEKMTLEARARLSR